MNVLVTFGWKKEHFKALNQDTHAVIQEKLVSKRENANLISFLSSIMFYVRWRNLTFKCLQAKFSNTILTFIVILMVDDDYIYEKYVGKNWLKRDCLYLFQEPPEPVSKLLSIINSYEDLLPDFLNPQLLVFEIQVAQNNPDLRIYQHWYIVREIKSRLCCVYDKNFLL